MCLFVQRCLVYDACHLSVYRGFSYLVTGPNEGSSSCIV